MRQPGPPRRNQKPLDRQPRSQQPNDWRQRSRDTASPLNPKSPFGSQTQEKLIPFRHKPPLIDQPSEP
jgi:hypothetical protein